MSSQVPASSEATNSGSPPLLVLVRDLLFSSRIRSAAKLRGVDIVLLREPAKLADHAGRRLIVDLNQNGALDAAAAWKLRTGGAVTGFVSHVDRATIGRARSLGIDAVLPRSVFVERLEQILRGDVESSG